MGMPNKIYASQLVQIQPEGRLAATSELNLASSMVTCCYEANGIGYWAATQVRGLSPEICIVSEVDVVHSTKGGTLIAMTERSVENSTGSETVARYQRAGMGTWDSQILQTTLGWSDQRIVPMKQGNASGGKGLAGELLGQENLQRTKRRIDDGNKTGLITYPEIDGEVLLKIQMRKNLMSGSVRGLIAASRRMWL